MFVTDIHKKNPLHKNDVQNILLMYKDQCDEILYFMYFSWVETFTLFTLPGFNCLNSTIQLSNQLYKLA